MSCGKRSIMRKMLITLLGFVPLVALCNAAEAAESYPTYLCKTASEPIRYDAVMLIDHAENPKLRGVVTLEDLTSLPADFTAVKNGPWRSYDGLVAPNKTDTMWVDGLERTVALAKSSKFGWVLIKNRDGGEMTISTCVAS